MKKIEFNLELAKKIESGEMNGRITTRYGLPVRILCFDAKTEDKLNIIALVDFGSHETIFSYTDTGYTNISGVPSIQDLFLVFGK